MRKKYKVALVIISILLLICIALAVFRFVLKDKNKKTAVSTSIVDKMDDYGYALDDKDGKLFKEKYYELKEIINKDEIDFTEYGKKITELFVIDLYTISTKINKYDVGGVDFVYENEKEMFKNKVMDTLYSDVEDNSYETRKQELPTVSEVNITDEKEIKGYEYTLEIKYEKDLKYDSKAKVTVVKDDNKMYIVEYTAIK